jgi:tRNA threonylcarbamoyladenosine biosynthesis protein TsaE
VEAVLLDAAATEQFGRCLARICRPGDLIILSGDLGAGKTTLTRGLGAGLGVRGAVTSPTFVVARRHPHPRGGTELIHVDAYRLGSRAEIDDLDLLDAADKAVTVVEWGADRVEHLCESRLHIEMHETGDHPQARQVILRPTGPRWRTSDVEALARCAGA